MRTAFQMAMASSASPELAPGKVCGSCMMCCKLPPIREFKKPAGVWCRHAVTGKGCSIYAERPAFCQAFYCGWMRSPSLGPEWKPDRAKFVIGHRSKNFLGVWVDPSYPDAWTKPPFFAQIKRWAVESAAQEQFVLVRIGARLIVVLPDREVDLGPVDPEAPLAFSREHGPAGPTYDIAVGPMPAQPGRGAAP
jgi:hypothetical protein